MNFNIDRRSKIPLSQQIEVAIKTQITKGDLPKDHVLLSTTQLAAQIGVDPETVDKAYQTLSKDNYIELEEKKWQVRYGRTPKFYFDQIYSTFELFKKMGLNPSIQTIEVKVMDTPDKIKDVVLEAKVIYCRRVYLGSKKPIMVMDCYFPHSRFKDFDVELKQSLPYYEALIQKYGVVFGYSERTFEAINLDKEIAHLLNVFPETAAGLTYAKSYDSFGHLFEVVATYSLPETMHFVYEQEH